MSRGMRRLTGVLLSYAPALKEWELKISKRRTAVRWLQVLVLWDDVKSRWPGNLVAPRFVRDNRVLLALPPFSMNGSNASLPPVVGVFSFMLAVCGDYGIVRAGVERRRLVRRIHGKRAGIPS
jgi:hypothetical protein